MDLVGRPIKQGVQGLPPRLGLLEAMPIAAWLSYLDFGHF
jgi:hypothetical protein